MSLKEKRDNAGCYLCSYLILSLPSLRPCTGIKIIRYDSVTHSAVRTFAASVRKFSTAVRTVFETVLNGWNIRFSSVRYPFASRSF